MLSIVIATYNSQDTIVRCLESVISQKFIDYEILIKDGGSTDKTMELISSCDVKISYIESSVDKGVYDAWNYCVPKISGDWFTFLGADDYYCDNFFSRLLAELSVAYDQGKYVVYGKNRIIDEFGTCLEDIGDPWSIAKSRMDSVMTLRHPGCFYHRSLIFEVGLFDSKFKIAGDHHYTLRCLKHTEPHFYDFVGVYHQMGGLSTNPLRSMQVIRETYMIRKELDFKPYLKVDSIFLKRVSLLMSSRLLGASATNHLFRYFRRCKKLFS